MKHSLDFFDKDQKKAGNVHITTQYIWAEADLVAAKAVLANL